MSYEEFRRRIDTARQVLVGAVPSPAGQIDQITYALMYKFMNDRDDAAAAMGGSRSFFVGEYAKYNWHELMKLGGHDQLNLYRQALESMGKNENIPELFRSIYQNAFLPFNSPNVLHMFLKEIDKFNHGESDDIGDAYEYLLSITGAQGDVGQFRTPRHIIKFIVEAVTPTKDDKVLDPAVGTAGFLIAAYNHVKAQHDGKDEQGNANNEHRLTADEKKKIFNNYRGFDIDPAMVRTAKVNMYLHGFPTPDIINHDSLSNEDYWDDWYDVILANPPFMSPKGGIQPHKKFGVTANRAEVLFVDYIASHLKPNGRAGIVVPEGVIFQSGKAYKELRKNMVENYLYAVVSLPSGVFQPYTGVKTSILLFDKQLATERNELLFVDVRHTGISLGSTGKKIEDNDLPEALKTILTFKKGEDIDDSELAFVVSKDEIRSNTLYDLKQSLYRKRIEHSGEFELVRLGDLTTITKGKSSSTKTPPGEYPLVLMAEQFKTSEHYDFDGTGVCVPLMTAASTGVAVMKRVHYIDGRFALANLLAFVEPKDKSILEPKFLYRVLLSEVDNLAKLMKGAANVSMKTYDLEEFKIPLPPIEIQREIVAELDGYQKIIDAAQTIVKTYKPTIKIKQEWKLINIEEAAKIDNGNAFKSSEYVDSGARVIRITNVQKGKIIDSQPKYLDANRIAEFSKYELFEGDLLMSLTGNVGRVGLYPREMLPGLLNQRVARIRTDEAELDKKYLFYLLNRDDFERAAVISSSGIAQKNMSTEWLKKFKIPLPPIEIQREIVADLDAEQKLIDANKKLIEIYQQKIKTKIAEVWGE
jgi:type I restriction enzyme M protein